MSSDPEKFSDYEKALRADKRKRELSQAAPRDLGVLVQELRVVGSGAIHQLQPTFGSLFSLQYAIHAINTMRHAPLRHILDGFDGVVRPGEMLLVLGKPNAGCSTFLKTLACQHREYHSIEGQVHYDSFTSDEINRHYRGDVIYVPEEDIHFPTLTVDETLRFAAFTRFPRDEETNREHSIATAIDVLQNAFGLRRVRETRIGDHSTRGLSGGEKKRVTIAEALSLRFKIGAWDNPTRGLDASTALEFVRALRSATDVDRLTNIVSLYQAGDSLYELFDKVCIIHEGRMAYFGPAGAARQYFVDLGYEPVPRQTTTEFLVAVTDPHARIIRSGFEAKVPRTPSQFASRFSISSLGAENRADMDDYRDKFVNSSDRRSAYRRSAMAEKAVALRKTSPFNISIFMQITSVMRRRIQILRGSILDQLLVLASYILFAILLGTVYYRSPVSTDAYFSRAGALFYTVLFITLSSMAEIPALFSQRDIVIKHYKAAMYHPFVEAAALTIVDLPITFLTTAAYSVILYFLVGLQSSASQFFTFFLFLFCLAFTMKACIRAVAASVPDPATAQTIAGVMLLALILYTGFALPKPTMVGGLRWITYLNPMRWGFEAIMSNEFFTIDGTCQTLIPAGEGYQSVSLANKVCTTVGSVPGKSTVDGNAYILLSYGYAYKHTWMNLGIVIAYGIFFLLLLLLFTEINTATATQMSIILFRRLTSTSIPGSHDASSTPLDEEQIISSSNLNSDLGQRPIGTIPSDSNNVFTWQHLHYDVSVRRGENMRLLDDVSGYVAPGKLTALMGESGAGKTTLLNVLAQRTSVGTVTGDMLVNGEPLPVNFPSQTGYCQQIDTHLPTATVREALMFSATLRQPMSVPVVEKEAYVDTVLHMCGLEHLADAVVGTLNVEFRKRTTIGVELAAKPKLLLFLDEPTSGLDSQSARAIIQCLRELADNGQAILCTIHQPSVELFQMFDKLLLLQRGGQTVYFGDIGTNSEVVLRYFEAHGPSSCPVDANPAEWILDTIGAGATATASLDWHDQWNKSQEQRDVLQEVDSIIAQGKKTVVTRTNPRDELSSSWTHQTRTLWRRDVQRHWRDPIYLMNKLMLNVIGGLFMGFTFFKAKDSLQATQNKLFATFMAFIISAPIGDQIHIPFVQTRDVYELRERSSRMYSWTALLASQILGEIPLNIFGSSVFFCIWYWLVGLPTDRAGYSYLMYGLAFPFYYTTFVMMLAAMAPSSLVASLLYFFFFTFAVTFTGMLQPFHRLGWWKWMYRLTPFTYLVEGFASQAVGHAELRCSEVEFAALTPPPGQTCQTYMQAFIETAGGYLFNSTTNGDADSCLYCPARTTDEFIGANFNMFWEHRWRDFGFIWIYVLFNTIAIFGFTYLLRIRKYRGLWIFSGRDA